MQMKLIKKNEWFWLCKLLKIHLGFFFLKQWNIRLLWTTHTWPTNMNMYHRPSFVFSLTWRLVKVLLALYSPLMHNKKSSNKMCTCHTHIFSVKNTPCCVWSTSCASSFSEWLTCSGTSMAEVVCLRFGSDILSLQWDFQKVQVSESQSTISQQISPYLPLSTGIVCIQWTENRFVCFISFFRPWYSFKDRGIPFPRLSLHQKPGKNRLRDDDVIEVNMTVGEFRVHCRTHDGLSYIQRKGGRYDRTRE